MIIDAHNHADWLGYSFQKTIDNMNESGIDKAILLSWDCPADEYDPEANHLYNVDGPGPISLQSCLSYKAQAPERFIIGYAPDFRRPDAIDKLKAARNLYDVKVCGEVKLRAMYDNFDAIELFRYCGSIGMPVILHLEYPLTRNGRYPRPHYWYGGTIDTLERVLVECPETNFLGHAPGFWAHIGDDEQFLKTDYPTGEIESEGKIAKLLRKYSNLYCDISAYSGFNALSRDAEYTKKFILEFENRIIYARDCYDNYHRDVIERLDLNADIKDKIYSGNILKLIVGL